MLRITRSGTKLWKELPVLLAATQHLNEHVSGGNQA
jgi:hypothetical protein